MGGAAYRTDGRPLGQLLSLGKNILGYHQNPCWHFSLDLIKLPNRTIISLNGMSLKVRDHTSLGYPILAVSTGCLKKMSLLSGFEFLTLGRVFLGVKNKLGNNRNIRLFRKFLSTLNCQQEHESISHPEVGKHEHEYDLVAVN